MSDMQDFIVRLNISRFRQQISKEADSHARSLLEHLLAAEEEKLHEIMVGGGARFDGDRGAPGPGRS